MKKLYWRPQKVSLRVLWLVAVLAVGGSFFIEHFKTQQLQPFYREKVRAARLAQQAYQVIKEERLKRRIPIDEEADPTRSGLLGELLTPVTTNRGHLPSKLTAINPNFAAVMVHLLKRAEVEQGDIIAVGVSGSFPGMNISTYAAIQTLGLQPIIISSVGSSQWGANDPKFLWPDMEKFLYDQRVFQFRSVAISRGGLEDKALGLSDAGRQIIERSMTRSGLEKIELETYAESVARRMEIYRSYAAGAPIKAYINVGGGTASVGAKLGRSLFKTGLNRDIPPGVDNVNSVMASFITEGTPVIHIINMNKLAERYGLPMRPQTPPALGEGTIFSRLVPNRTYAVAVLVTVLLLLFAFVRLDWGYRILSAGRRDTGKIRPEEMV